MPRAHYDHQLQHLQDDLLRLGAQVEAAVGVALDAFVRPDSAAAHRVIADADSIHRAQYALEEQALTLIARQAPLAADLRLISAVIAVAGELARIGEYAEGTAKLALRAAAAAPMEPPPQLVQMAPLAQGMLRDALDALVQRDLEAARRIAAADDAVDALTTAVQDALIERLRAPTHVEGALHVVCVAHNLERIADRATNIAERILFLVTGDLIEPHPCTGSTRA